jgi:hypothetical protein
LDKSFINADLTNICRAIEANASLELKSHKYVLPKISNRTHNQPLFNLSENIIKDLNESNLSKLSDIFYKDFSAYSFYVRYIKYIGSIIWFLPKTDVENIIKAVRDTVPEDNDYLKVPDSLKISPIFENIFCSLKTILALQEFKVHKYFIDHKEEIEKHTSNTVRDLRSMSLIMRAVSAPQTVEGRNVLNQVRAYCGANVNFQAQQQKTHKMIPSHDIHSESASYDGRVTRPLSPQ